MSDEAMAKLPQRSLGGVGKKTVVRTIASGLVADLGPRVRRTGGGGGAPPDAGRAREEARRAGMSEEDRAWEDASLRRERARRGAVAGTPRPASLARRRGVASRWRRWWRRVTRGA